jgi:hypothetical protein
LFYLHSVCVFTVSYKGLIITKYDVDGIKKVTATTMTMKVMMTMTAMMKMTSTETATGMHMRTGAAVIMDQAAAVGTVAS